jgi:transposase InsO family protein
LASPPEQGELQARLSALAEQPWELPDGSTKRFSFATVERWFYGAKKAQQGNPIDTLGRKPRTDAGHRPTVSEALAQAIAEQYRDHPTWTYQLHRDNFVALAASRPELGRVPSTTTVRRYMQEHGFLKQKKKRSARAAKKLEAREFRSWEVRYVNQLWHLDFHEGSRSVLTAQAQWCKPWMLGILDDHSRLACHVQWYLVENAENLVHGLSQALQKRGRPAALMTDGGGAMKAGETQEGLGRLSIQHAMTLPETPQQNGKQENFWTQVEQRLLPMLEGVPDLTLRLLNEATQAWVEGEYNQHLHSEIKQTPIERFLTDKRIGGKCPDAEVLRRAFRRSESRAQRRSDGTISVAGQRYEVPSRYRTLRRISVRYPRWDLTSLEMVDPRTDAVLCTLYPLDREANADRKRKLLEPVADPVAALAQEAPRKRGVAPLLRQLMQDYAATGLPPAYLPKDESELSEEIYP